jgi:hypothetical protein
MPCQCSGFAVFLYVNLDCMDGKQARRTKSSSPLGQLFDHGCDALALGLLLTTVRIAMRVPWGWEAVGVELSVSRGKVLGCCGIQAGAAGGRGYTRYMAVGTHKRQPVQQYKSKSLLSQTITQSLQDKAVRVTGSCMNRCLRCQHQHCRISAMLQVRDWISLHTWSPSGHGALADGSLGGVPQRDNAVQQRILGWVGAHKFRQSRRGHTAWDCLHILQPGRRASSITPHFLVQVLWRATMRLC